MARTPSVARLNSRTHSKSKPNESGVVLVSKIGYAPAVPARINKKEPAHEESQSDPPTLQSQASFQSKRIQPNDKLQPNPESQYRDAHSTNQLGITSNISNDHLSN
ncbi:hypothetical protein Nepgr_022979 [Nepenthes gracilis]|uniref:Uncharacterized protein n=1 Tax=Nepenthes gracilis TaxID=150966 RepID=A0AAD3T316_NEPGR|nr:hypothetical protein Nepgr_022979 [Nepenthes gracilis]